MSGHPFPVGERVLALRGEEHAEARVVDAYELLMNGESRPMVVVEFDGGDRAWLPAGEPDVRPLPSGEEPATHPAASASAV